MRRAAAVLAAGVITLATAAVPAGGQGSGGGKPAQGPVRISAEAAEYLNAENRVIFTGKVVAVQDDATLTADRMEVRFAPASSGGEEAAPQGGIVSAGTAGATLETIVATGSVTFRQVDAESGTERYATGERGEYDAVKRVVTLSGGSPRAWEGQNVVNCEIMVFALEAGSMTCSGKVKMTVYPAGADGKGKAAGDPPAVPAPTPAGSPGGP